MVARRSRSPTIGGRPLEIGLRLDPVSAVMLLVVTIVGLCVQVYSLGYMHQDERKGWYFAVLSLFSAAMLDARARRRLPAAVHVVGGHGAVLATCSSASGTSRRDRARRRSRRSSPRASATSASRSGSRSCAATAHSFAHRTTVLGVRLGLDPAARDSPSRCCCSSARWASPRRCRCTSGCPTRWPAPRPPRRSSTPRRWSPPASTSSSARCRSSAQASAVGAARRDGRSA